MNRPASSGQGASPARRGGRPARVPGGALLLGLLAAAAGCRREAAPSPPALRDVVERGPVRLSVEVTPARPRVGDRVRVELTVAAPEGWAVRFPAPAELGEDPAREEQTPDPRPGPSGLLWRKTYLLEPLLSGPREIPALAVRCTPVAPAGTQPAAESELVTRPLRLEVDSALTEGDRPDRPRDITGTLLPPRPPWPAWAWALLAGGLVAAGLAAGGAYRWIRARRLRPPPPLLPEVWALRALAELERAGWSPGPAARGFYYRLTEVVRSYIERKFGLAAPEMTTEEFLRVLARNPRALPCDAALLRDLLQACDLVKYAALQPQRSDADAALAAARAFVQASAAAAQAAPPAAGGRAA